MQASAAEICSLTESLQLAGKIGLIEMVSVEDLALDFTVPGYDIELKVRRHDMRF